MYVSVLGATARNLINSSFSLWDLESCCCKNDDNPAYSICMFNNSYISVEIITFADEKNQLFEIFTSHSGSQDMREILYFKL